MSSFSEASIHRSGRTGPAQRSHRPAKCASLAALLGMPADVVNVGGKPLEGLGALAKGAAVEAQAMAPLQADRA